MELSLTSNLRTIRLVALAFVVSAAVLVGALAAAHGASAASPATHVCVNRYGGWVYASQHTSCGFANNMAVGWAKGRCFRWTKCSGEIFSPSTSRWYVVDCVERGWQPIRTFCRAVHTDAWIRFVWTKPGS